MFGSFDRDTGHVQLVRYTCVDDAGTHEGYFCDAAERAKQAALPDTIRRKVATRMPGIKTTNDHRHRRCDLAFDVGESVSLPRAEIDALVGLIEGGLGPGAGRSAPRYQTTAEVARFRPARGPFPVKMLSPEPTPRRRLPR